ncbi:MAG: wbbL 5, partial [Planctomycetaceae bacterium]|nr:wbbL 5 [Planctomycetaceae bacterium]
MSWADARVAVVFDNSVRRETTGVYCRHALSELVSEGRLAEIEHVLPCELPHVSIGQFDLALHIDDGMDYEIPQLGCPSIFWAIDTHMDFSRCLKKARQATWTFASQKMGAKDLAASGVKHVAWLPLACDPARHARQDVPIDFDISFVGNIFPGPRSDLVEFIRSAYSRSFIGRKYFEEMARVYSASKLVFNRSLNNDLNMRVFEGLCSGSLLVTDDLAEFGLSELFQNEVHLVTYRDQADLKMVIDYFLVHEDERVRIADAGRREVLTRHTYRHRMETILEQISNWSTDAVQTQRIAALLPGSTQLSEVPDVTGWRESPACEPTSFIKQPGYFDCARPEILELIPATARRVLDIGCGTGRLGEFLKARQDAMVTGIEMNTVAARLAATRLDAVHAINIEDPLVEFDAGQFDCVVCADILEHLRHPERVLTKIQHWLTADGCVVVSVPNVRNHTVIRSLLAGNWTYESAGLLDEDHVRFFTRRELEKLFVRGGFKTPELRMVTGEGFDSWVQQGRPRQVSVGGLQIRASGQDDAAEFFAYQFLARSQPIRKRNWGLTSIILITHNQWPYTQQCLDSIRMRTDEPYELIVVDNGSTDGTIKALKRWGGVTLIDNETNRGFPTAVNQGLAIAKGDNLLLLNNDTLVTTGWLSRMLDAIHSKPEIGLLGPVSNCVSGEQQVEVS